MLVTEPMEYVRCRGTHRSKPKAVVVLAFLVNARVGAKPTLLGVLPKPPEVPTERPPAFRKHTGLQTRMCVGQGLNCKCQTTCTLKRSFRTRLPRIPDGKSQKSALRPAGEPILRLDSARTHARKFRPGSTIDQHGITSVDGRLNALPLLSRTFVLCFEAWRRQKIV
jgi:hypothetical protein